MSAHFAVLREADFVDQVKNGPDCTRSLQTAFSLHRTPQLVVNGTHARSLHSTQAAVRGAITCRGTDP
jgi:hypothetical protein